MRGFSGPDLAGRCPRCVMRSELCLCGDLSPVADHTEVLILRHEKEGWRTTNTARVAELALSRCQVVEWGGREMQLPDLAGSWLLFPGTGPSIPAGPRPERLVVLDGSWRQARRIFLRCPALHALPRLSLPAPAVAAPRLRAAPDPAAMSTLEAIARALEILDGATVAAALDRAHALSTERVLTSRGLWPRGSAA
ncbi:tRNA-uridine aminocarboxypropyltransferase [Vulgatibacter sp.]|uniref:tRNA-uridine aminocarboxypropyltransferase n=1 Tax=Vulgatibacter sp. TaxID=1971226 RepID=UPI00356661CC